MLAHKLQYCVTSIQTSVSDGIVGGKKGGVYIHFKSYLPGNGISLHVRQGDSTVRMGKSEMVLLIQQKLQPR